MKKDHFDLWVTFNEGLEVTWIRQFKIDATKQLTKRHSAEVDLVDSYSLSPS